MAFRDAGEALVSLSLEVAGGGLPWTVWGECLVPLWAAKFNEGNDDVDFEEEWLAPAAGDDDCELLDKTTGGDAGKAESGAGDGTSKLITGGEEFTVSLGITASSSSSELSRVKSITGPLLGLDAAEAEVSTAGADDDDVVLAVTDNNKWIHFINN